MRLRTVLCPIDFSDLSRQEVTIAVEVGRAFGARLVLHHNRAAIAPAMARKWDWDSTHVPEGYSEAEAERRMKEVLATVPADVTVEGTVSTGPVGVVVLSLAERLPADLIVLGSHGWSTPDHVSVTERVVAQAPCPVLTFTDGHDAVARFRLHGDEPVDVVVPSDFSATAQHAVRYACALARVRPIRLEMLHVLGAAHGQSIEAVEAAEERLRASVPEDLRASVSVRVRRGTPIHEILAHLEERRPAFAVVGEHARDVFRHLLTRDTTRAVVHAAPCPVWVVPARTPVD